MESAGLKFEFMVLKVQNFNHVHEGISIPTELRPTCHVIKKNYLYTLRMHQEHKHMDTYSYTFSPFSTSSPEIIKAQLISSPSQTNRWRLFSFFFLENILLISWYKSLHCGTLSNMNLSFLSRGRAFQPCQKGPHCGGPETPEFLAVSKRDLRGKKKIWQPDFKPRHFLLAGNGLCLQLRRVSHCCATSEWRQHKGKNFAFLPLFKCLHGVAVMPAQSKQHSFIYYTSR